MTGQEKTVVLRTLSMLLVHIKAAQDLVDTSGCREDVGRHLHRALSNTHTALDVFMSSSEKEEQT